MKALYHPLRFNSTKYDFNKELFSVIRRFGNIPNHRKSKAEVRFKKEEHLAYDKSSKP